jgi:hypothetical protein
MRHSRSIVAVIVGVVAVLGVVVSVTAAWAHQVLFDSSRVAGAVEETLARPEVTDSLTAYITDEIVEAVAQQAPGAVALLPDGSRQLVEDAVRSALTAPSTQRVVAVVVEQAHAGLIRVLEGGSLVDGVSIVDDTVTVNLLPIAAFGLDALQQRGLLAGITVPDLPADGDPMAQVAALEAATGRNLPDDLGQLVVYRSDAVAEAGVAIARAQHALVVVRRALVATVALTALAAALSILLARKRLRAVGLLAVGVAGAMGVARWAVGLVRTEAPLVVRDATGRVAVSTMVSDLSAWLLTAVSAVLIAALVVGAVALFGGVARPRAQ